MHTWSYTATAPNFSLFQFVLVAVDRKFRADLQWHCHGFLRHPERNSVHIRYSLMNDAAVDDSEFP
jgi:hypothetical protein